MSEVKQQQPATSLNMKVYEHVLNKQFSTISFEEAAQLMSGSTATEADISRHIYHGNMGACLRIYNQKKFVEWYIKWYEEKTSQPASRRKSDQGLTASHTTQ